MSTQITSKLQAVADWHKADIKAALEKAGWSLRRLSLHHNYSPWALQHALVRPWPKAERLLAEAIGMTPDQLWPSRYRQNGTSNRRRGRPTTANAHSRRRVASSRSDAERTEGSTRK